MQFKERKFGKIANSVLILIQILFLGYAIAAFMLIAVYDPLIRIGMIFAVGLIASVVFFNDSKKEEISKRNLYFLLSIIFICSISNTIIDTIIDHGSLWYCPLITMPVAVIGITVTILTILALREREEDQ